MIAFIVLGPLASAVVMMIGNTIKTGSEKGQGPEETSLGRSVGGFADNIDK